MNKIQEVIEKKALELFRADNKANQTEFILTHATIEEFYTYLSQKAAYGLQRCSLLNRYGDNTLGSILLQGIGESFVREVLWPKLKDEYVEKVTLDLMNKLEPSIKITIEQV